ncbi:MAG: 5-formyltetrahydrofolate cyclo-ligase [Gammaproteobacteria bacterium]|jgi:5-formyltetrahydrofolate cyclo-ligase|nr:5-formyltetrahydrofolate cyclo-ligase [Gammaproteobacteria bacterium]
MRAARRALDARDQHLHGLAVARLLCSQPSFLRARSVGAYLAADGELDPAPLIALAVAAGKRCFLPVLHPFAGPALWFCEWRPGDPLAPNRYAIPEPVATRRAPQPARALDLLLVPLVAFDDAGNRLGMGGGYYDRTLAYLRVRRHWRRPRVIGLAHALQRVASLPKNAWDVPVDAVVTERTVHRVERMRE